MVTGPLNAIGAPPSSPDEAAVAGLHPGALPIYRMLAKPSLDAVTTAIQQYRAGNKFSKNEYDAQGNYTPSAFSAGMDATPIAGPWARSIENDAQQKGMVPALAGLGTDLLAPKDMAKGVGLAAQGAGKAAQMASTTLPSVKMAGTRFLVKGSPGELLQSALKPGVKYGAGVGDTLQTALPDVLKADPAMQGVSGFAKASDTARDAAYQPYNNLLAPYRPALAADEGAVKFPPANRPAAIGPVRPGTIDGNPIADAQNTSSPAINRFESPSPKPSAAPPPIRFSQPMGGFRGNTPAITPPAVRALSGIPSANEPYGIVATTAAKADLYRKPIGVSTADTIREDANAKLNAFYSKTGGDQNAALSSPETARIKAIGDTTRQQLYPTLETNAGLQPGTVAAMQQKYGTLSDVSDIANKREPVFARHDPVSLSQKIVSGHGNPLSMAWNYAVSKGLTNLTNSDALVNSAVDRFTNPTETPLPPRPGIFPAMGSAIGGGLYGVGKAAATAPLMRNPLFYSSANPPKRK